MFEVGSYVMHGKSGVCTVEAVGPIEIDDDKGRYYYTLLPVYNKTSRVFMPVDSDKIVIRPVISKKEADALIRDFKKLDLMMIPNEKGREAAYKENIKKCDCRETLRMIKTISDRSRKRLANGSKVTASDEKYLHMAKDRLYGEFAISLNIAKDKVEDYITSGQKQ